MFCGHGKPPLNLFVTPLIKEILHLRSIGFLYRNVRVKIGKIIFVCDAVARAFLQCIRSHAAAYGCGYCRSKGRYISNRIVYPTKSGALRCDEEYAIFKENNQTSLSPIQAITGLLSGFPVDYQHAALLGVVRRLFLFYFSSVKGFRLRCKVPFNNLTVLSDRSVQLAPFIPSDFQRRPRRFDTELKHFKACEFRMFVLYLGPFLFKEFLPKRYYDNFILLHFSLYVFCSERLCALRPHAEYCLQRFVSEIPKLFGEAAVSYNFHILLHLPYFVDLYGVCDSFSAFPFESFLGNLKRRTKKTRFYFEHSISQLEAIRSSDINSKRCSQPLFSVSRPNNCALFDGSTVVIIKSISPDGMVVSGHRLHFLRDLYTYPYPISSIGIGFYRSAEDSDRVISGRPSGKAICIPVKKDFLVLPLSSS